MTTVGELAAITTIRVPSPGWDPNFQIVICRGDDGYTVGYLASDTTPPVGTPLTREPDRDGIPVFGLA
jgi:hypothetical protein